MVIMASLGRRSTGGYSVAIAEVRNAGDII
jgi:hypothetical protein